MSWGRFAAAAAGVWVVRVALNWTFYTQVVGGQYQQMMETYPGMFREVLPAYIFTDLIFSVAFSFLFAKVGAALGGGMKAGIFLGVIVAILSPVVGLMYHYYSFTFLPRGLAMAELFYQVIAHAIQGAVAGLIYKR